MKQVLMTRAEFEEWLAKRDVWVSPQVSIERCVCGDVNCHGWRLVRR